MRRSCRWEDRMCKNWRRSPLNLCSARTSDKFKKKKDVKTGIIMISLTRELTSDLDVVSCSQLGFFIHAESLGVGRAAGYNPVGQDKYIPYLTLHTVHTLNFSALKHLSRLLPTLQHSQTLWIPLGSALLTRHSSQQLNDSHSNLITSGYFCFSSSNVLLWSTPLCC